MILILSKITSKFKWYINNTLSYNNQMNVEIFSGIFLKMSLSGGNLVIVYKIFS